MFTPLNPSSPTISPESCSFADNLTVSITHADYYIGEPFLTIFDNSGFLWTANIGAPMFSKYSAATGELLDFFGDSGEGAPNDITLDAQGNIWVAYSSGSVTGTFFGNMTGYTKIYKIVPSTGEISSVVPFDANTNWAHNNRVSKIGFNSAGRLLAAFPAIGELGFVNTSTGAIEDPHFQDFGRDAPTGFSFSDSGDTCYVVYSGMDSSTLITSLSATTLAYIDNSPLISLYTDWGASSIIDNSKLYVGGRGSITIVNLSDLSIHNTIFAGGTTYPTSNSVIYSLKKDSAGEIWGNWSNSIFRIDTTNDVCIHEIPLQSHQASYNLSISAGDIKWGANNAQVIKFETGGVINYSPEIPESFISIYYTTDASEPSSFKTLYVNPWVITETTTVRATVLITKCNPSGISQEIYTKLTRGKQCSNVLRTKLNQQFVAIKDGDFITCLLLQPSVGWKTVGAINFEPSVVKDISLANESFGSLLCMVQLSGGTVKRYRSKSQGAVWQDVTSEVT